MTELYTYQFAATKDHFAFLHQRGDGQRDLVVYQASGNKITLYRPRSRNIWTLSPNGAKDGGFLIGCSGGITPDQLRAGQTVTSTLFQCQNGKCSPVFEFQGSIANPIDLGDGKLIFIGAKPQVIQRSFPFYPPFSPEFVGYRKSDFYFRAGDRIERITEWEAGLGPASLGKDRLVFNFMQNPVKQTAQLHFPAVKSQIWAAKLTYDDASPHLAFESDLPFVEFGKNFDTKPSISPEGRKTAFLSSSGYTSDKKWRYDIAIVDNATKNELITVAPEDGTKLSLPVFVDNDRVRFMSFDGGRYSFREISVSAKQEKVLGQVTPEDLAKAEVVYVEDAPADSTRHADLLNRDVLNSWMIRRNPVMRAEDHGSSTESQ